MKLNLTMKSSIIMIIFFVWFVPFLSEGHFVRQKLKSIEFEINLISNNINDLEKQFTSEPNSQVSKADLITFNELNKYNNKVSQLQLESKLELLNNIQSNTPLKIISLSILLYLYYSVKKIGDQIRSLEQNKQFERIKSDSNESNSQE